MPLPNRHTSDPSRSLLTFPNSNAYPSPFTSSSFCRVSRRNAGPVCSSARYFTAATVSASSAGWRTAMFGSARIAAMSSSAICEAPSSPIPMPAWVPAMRTFASL